MSLTSVDAFIMGKIFKFINSSSGGIQDVIPAIIPKIPLILLMVFVKKCLENMTDVWSSFKDGFVSVMKRIFYTDVLLEGTTSSDNKNYYLKKAIEKRIFYFKKSFIPMYWSQSEENTDVSYVKMIKWIPEHALIMSMCENDATKLQGEYVAAKTKKNVIYKKFKSNGYENNNISMLYPSKNYKKLVKIIKKHFEISKLVKCYSSLGMIIDGLPGLGKTKFADFAAQKKLAGHIFKVDMTGLLKLKFDALTDTFYHNIPIVTDTIFLIDEIDKYIDYRISVEYDEYISNNKSKKDENNINKTYDEFKTHSKITFLYEMLRILERDGLEHSVIVIFCSNNFNTIFEGIDITHHKSLYDRFLKISFQKCNQQEIIQYMLHYNKRFIDTKFYCNTSQEELEKLLNINVEVTHRTLHHISIKAEYNIFEMIKLLNISDEDPQEEMLPIVNENKNFVSSNEIPQEIKCGIKKKIDKADVKTDDDSDKTLDDESDKTLDDELCEECGNVYEDCICESLSEESCIVSVLNVQEHEKIWYGKYVLNTNLYDNELKIKIVNKIKYYLSACDEHKSNGDKTCIVVELFDYLAFEGYNFMVFDAKFKICVVNKINELYIESPELFYLLKDDTKEFIYAASGIKC